MAGSKTIKVSVSTNLVGSQTTSEFEVDGEATPAEIEDAAQEAMFEMIEWFFTVDGKPWNGGES